jgi:hypothetical protein
MFKQITDPCLALCSTGFPAFRVWHLIRLSNTMFRKEMLIGERHFENPLTNPSPGFISFSEYSILCLLALSLRTNFDGFLIASDVQQKNKN